MVTRARQEVPLVPGELRGYRQFDLRDDGLYPLVHAQAGPWSSDLEQARCEAGAEHKAPSRDCRCGLYAWYLPGAATVALGPASAVIVARGRTVLGDRGFRAGAARIEAVSLPVTARWGPAARRARRMLAEQYPSARVYSSPRRMLADHPPHDVRALGVNPPPDRSRAYRAVLVGVWAAVVVAVYSLVAVPRDTVAELAAQWWPALIVVAIGWQAALVWLVVRLMALQGSSGSGVGNGGPWKEHPDRTRTTGTTGASE